MAADNLSWLWLYMIVIAGAPALSSGSCTSRTTHRGRDFLITYPRLNDDGDDTALTIYLTSVTDGSATLTSNIIATQTYNLTAWDVTNISVDTASIQKLRQETSGIQRKFIQINASIYISVFVTSSSTAALVLPSSLNAGTEYLVTSYQPVYSSSNSFIVTASSDNTVVHVIDPDGNYNTYTLNATESYNEQSTTDLSGTRIESEQLVSVVVGNTGACVRKRHSYCYDMPRRLLNIPIPTSSWGMKFIVPFNWPRWGYLLRIIAGHSETSVSYGNYSRSGQMAIAAHNYIDILMGTSPTVILTDKPVTVVQYGKTYGDFMTVPPVERYDSDYLFPSPPTKSWYNTVVVMVHTSYKDGLLLDGQPLQGTQQCRLPAPLDDYTVVSVTVNGSVHSLIHTSPSVTFGAVMYGFNGFALPLGFRFGG